MMMDTATDRPQLVVGAPHTRGPLCLRPGGERTHAGRGDGGGGELEGGGEGLSGVSKSLLCRPAAA